MGGKCFGGKVSLFRKDAAGEVRLCLQIWPVRNVACEVCDGSLQKWTDHPPSHCTPFYGYDKKFRPLPV
ncbi:hypothetical protein LSTR_LSTR015098 [Laodelphax striatellus]|uniref:Uncharacterized protein n=1 Tax=Laodelphax striatellus TaxID=195883 RepID=A0A482WY29_LAOST|nr:hypothetical protein LSTR_LSTR015098 [Laodelphax striatellus]